MLKIENLSKTFDPGTPNEVRSLNRVSLAIEDGAFVLAIGSNGSGKSSLMNAIAGAFRPDAGRIELDGRDMTLWPDFKRARWIGRVFQNPFSGTAPEMSIVENLALASRRGKSRGLGWSMPKRLMHEFQDRIRSLGMGLEDRMDNAIGMLSGGQRQALTLLMATWIKPSLLLLDEHTAALDPKSADQVIHLTQEIVERERLTTLMVTHSMQQAARFGNRLIMMHRGAIIHDFSGADKKRLRAEDLLALFEDIRRSEQLDPTAAETLKRLYI